MLILSLEICPFSPKLNARFFRKSPPNADTSEKCYHAKVDAFDEVERKTRTFAESINAWKPSTMLALAKRRKRNMI